MLPMDFSNPTGFSGGGGSPAAAVAAVGDLSGEPSMSTRGRIRILLADG